MKAKIVQLEHPGVPGLVGPLAERSLVTEWESVSLEDFSQVFEKKGR